MDGVDFMLNKNVKLNYLEQDDALEALWLDLENYKYSAQVTKFCVEDFQKCYFISHPVFIS